ncbi:hypothetical protein [Hymenobacter tenuis]
MIRNSLFDPMRSQPAPHVATATMSANQRRVIAAWHSRNLRFTEDQELNQLATLLDTNPALREHFVGKMLHSRVTTEKQRRECLPK